MEVTRGAPGARGRGGRIWRQQPPSDSSDSETETDSEPDYAAGLPENIQVDDSPTYKIGTRLGKGSFGQVYTGHAITGGDIFKRIGRGAAEVAIKFEHKRRGRRIGRPYEWEVYTKMVGVPGVPQVHHSYQEGDYHLMIMDKLGPNLIYFVNDNPGDLPVAGVACIAVEAISILERIHSRGFVHGDVKPENLLLGPQGTPDEKKLYIVDLGLASRWKEVNSNLHVPYDQQPGVFRGTCRYASVHAHLGRTASRRNDLESLAYTLIYLLRRQLPWEGIQDDDKLFLTCKKKMETSPIELCSRCPQAFMLFTDYVVNLKFDEDPDYSKCISLFDGIVGTDSKSRSFNAEGALKLINQACRKRKNRLEDEEHEQPKKKFRCGTPVPQWISIYNDCKPIIQRYRYNVDDSRLFEEILGGRMEGLFIRAVASYQNLWALVMDSNTGFTEQVYERFPYDIDREWVMEQWDDNFFISAVAGTDNGCWLVVMSKGAPYILQSYKTFKSFPYTWIKTKWAAGYHVTSMATSNTRWAIVMSTGAGFLNQVVEIDFRYPSEEIRYRWDEDYSITAIAATPDQVAVILSRSSTEPTDEIQETRRTYVFPCSQIQDGLSRNRYLALICYGRSIS